MEVKITEKEAMRGKRFNITVFIIFAVLILSVVLTVSIFSIWYMCRPYSFGVMVDGIEQGIYQTLEIKINDDCYLLDGNDEFVKQFSFDEWILTKDTPSGDPITQFHFAEQWTLKLYADGQAKVNYGYASSKEKPTAYYIIPEGVLTKVNDYVEKYGEIPEKAFHNSIFY